MSKYYEAIKDIQKFIYIGDTIGQEELGILQDKVAELALRIAKNENKTEDLINTFPSLYERVSFVYKTDGHSFWWGFDDRTLTPFVSRHAPYDLTDYHWARQSPNIKNVHEWKIYTHDGKLKDTFQISCCVSQKEEKEIVAKKLIAMDKKEKLTTRIDRT